MSSSRGEPMASTVQPVIDDAGLVSLLARMTREEKVGQLQQLSAGEGRIPDALADAVRGGRVGSLINEVDVDTVNALQRIAVEESRLGIPLVFGRDVIHGFATVFPIPLGQAASWDPVRVERDARISALEAAAHGVHWTFAPMLDVGRDPRWGRVAEGYGEDPYLIARMGAAAIRGFQGPDLAAPGSIAACAKHFAGYGASEAGMDYNTTNVPEREMRNVHLPPFRAAVEAGVATVMTSFGDLDGIPATANEWLLRDVLRQEWGFDGAVVSDWKSVSELAVHGITADDAGSALAAAQAGVDIEMTSTTYADHLPDHIAAARFSERRLDAMVLNVLRLKLRLGLFAHPYTDPAQFPDRGDHAHLRAAQDSARASLVVLTNDGVLPLQPARVSRLALIGPMADEARDQLGTWIFDGDPTLSRTLLPALREAAGPAIAVEHARGLPTTRSHDRAGFAEAVAAAARADVAVLAVGEEAILSGEAHSRADIRLPGAQAALVEAVAATGTPVVLVIMAGRPLVLTEVLPHAAAMVYAWHPGTMGGPAIADLLLGRTAPLGRLPVSLPRSVGQIPLYYARKQTGRPATPETIVHVDDLPPHAGQTSTGNTCIHLDVHPSPLFPFGHGLGWSRCRYDAIRTDAPHLAMDGAITVMADVENIGTTAMDEVVQLYVRDLVGSITRPVRELKGFERVQLAPGERRTVRFTLRARDLAFHGRSGRLAAEPGEFHAWIGGDATADLRTQFTLLP